MGYSSLEKVYEAADARAKVIYVVPLIRYTHKQTDYLYLLYKDLIASDTYKIESISIFNHFKLITGILRNKNAILHYHWFEFQDFKSLAGMPWKVFCIWLFKKLGGTIIWTIHNEFPHDRRFFSLHSLLHKKMAQWSAKLHVHCKRAVNIMHERLKVPEEKFFVHPHPSYPATVLPREEAIQLINEAYQTQINPAVPVVLMFGNISRYKQLINAAESILELPFDCLLLIVGPIKKGNFGLFKQLRKIEKNSSRILVIPKFIPEIQVPWFHNAADICLFNYREILSSGGVHLALSYQKTIIAPNKGCLTELGEKKNVHLFEDEQGPDAYLRELLTS